MLFIQLKLDVPLKHNPQKLLQFYNIIKSVDIQFSYVNVRRVSNQLSTLDYVVIYTEKIITYPYLYCYLKLK